MSRTYRAKTGHRWWKERDPYYSTCERTWQWNPETISIYHESDNAHRDGSLGQTLKAHTNMRRRADTRRETSLVMKDVEHDYVSLENLYRSFIWIFD